MSRDRRTPTAASCLIAGTLIGACSGHHGAVRVLVKHQEFTKCTTDEAYVYVDEGGTIDRVDRKTGEAKILTNDTRGVFMMQAVGGSLFWIDSDGVFEWRDGANARTTVGSYPFGKGGSHLEHFRDELCWTQANQHEGVPHGEVDCFDLRQRTTRVAYKNDTTGLEVASDGSRLFVADFFDGGTSIVDITDAAHPEQLLHLPRIEVAFTAASVGPVIAERKDVKNPEAKIWIASRPPRSVPYTNGQREGLVTFVGQRAYLIADEPLRPVDLNTGALGPPLPAVRKKGDIGACGDDHTLYTLGDDGSLLELRNQ